MNYLNFIFRNILSFRMAAISSNVGFATIRAVAEMLGCGKAFKYLLLLLFSSIAVRFFFGMTPARGLALMIAIFVLMRLRMVGTFEWHLLAMLRYQMFHRWRGTEHEGDAN